MHKFSKIIAWAYLLVGIIFAVEVFMNWSTDRDKSYVSALMCVLAIFMFFFKQRFKNRQPEK